MDDRASMERVRAALSHLDPNDRDVWVRAAACIKSEFGDEGFQVWDDWGSQFKKYSPVTAKQVWRSVKETGGLTIASLFYDAKQAGWQDQGNYKKPNKAEIEARRARQAERAAELEAEEAAIAAAAADKAQAMWDAAVPAETHPYLERKGVKAHGLRVGNWELLNGETGEITIVHNVLLVPMRDRTRKLHSLQGIEPQEGGKKRYLKDGAKRGHFFAIGAKPLQQDGRAVFVLAEGYATAASVHEATGHMVLCCFDVGNLAPVSKALRERLPEAIILFAADNDTSTDGNPGVTKATKAASEIGGLVAVPPIEPGDFNDLQASHGTEAVAAVIAAALDPVEEHEEEPAAPVAPPPPPAEKEPSEISKSAHFSILGYDRCRFFFFVFEQMQIVALAPGELSEANLLMMAPLEWWEFNFPAPKGGMCRKTIMNWIFRTAHSRGLYDVARVRGRGAWDDEGRTVYHEGSMLYVDGVPTPVTKIRSRYVYELAKTEGVPSDVPLSDDDGRRLLAVAKMFRWSQPGAAALLAGWTFLAPVCGAIKWRPHIWLTGSAGSGKSTILNDYVSVCVGNTKVFSAGNSTESGLRQQLKADAIPVLFDESEQNNDGERRRMEAIMALIRNSSTDSVAQTYKGTVAGAALSFHIRSMFCLASIQVGMENKADQDRLTKLSLLKAQDDATAPQTWAAIKDELYKIKRDHDLPGRMLRRAINMLPVIQANIAVFIEAAAKKFGTQRMGDQYGTMVAGAWSLCRQDVATPEQAMATLDSYNWSEFTEGGETDDPEKALQCILEAKIMHKGESMSVASLIRAAAGEVVDGLTLDQKVAIRMLGETGMRIEKGKWLAFQDGSQALRHLLSGTQFEVDVRGQLLRIQGAQKLPAIRFPSKVSRAVGIPLELVADGLTSPL